MTAFEEALADIFGDDDFGRDAFHLSHATGIVTAMRIIESAPDEIAVVGRTSLSGVTRRVDVRLAEVQPATGDWLLVAGELLEIAGDPQRDAERLTARCTLATAEGTPVLDTAGRPQMQPHPQRPGRFVPVMTPAPDPLEGFY